MNKSVILFIAKIGPLIAGVYIATGSNAQVVAPAATRYQALTFSPDGSFLYFLRRDEEQHIIGILYAAPVLGGTPHVVSRDVDTAITFSPDGQHFAFLREKHDTSLWDLVVAKSDGSDERPLFKEKSLLSDSLTPAWSPDGKVILIPVVQPSKDAIGGFLSVDVATGNRVIPNAGVLADRDIAENDSTTRDIDVRAERRRFVQECFELFCEVVH